ncbi:MAG TPA: hypothetical protein VEO56_12940 [Bacteroidota bacterium]|nr:hypothetical protein [Bacteroidota bacterium]
MHGRKASEENSPPSPCIKSSHFSIRSINAASALFSLVKVSQIGPWARGMAFSTYPSVIPGDCAKQEIDYAAKAWYFLSGAGDLAVRQFVMLEVDVPAHAQTRRRVWC